MSFNFGNNNFIIGVKIFVIFCIAEVLLAIFIIPLHKHIVPRRVIHKLTAIFVLSNIELFKLLRFPNKIAKTIDIIILNDLSIRIYSNNVTLEESIELIKYSSNLLDPNLQKEKINETINYIKEHKYANGYYYGNIGLLLNGYEEKGYEIMIKNARKRYEESVWQ